MKNASRAVILFTGNSLRDERAKGLPPRFLGVVHEWLAETARGMGCTDLLLAGDDDEGFFVDAPGVRLRTPASALADRVGDAVSVAFASGYGSVVLLAGDVLGLRRETLERSFAWLESSENASVLGPSGDGGFYLAGFRRGMSIDWSAIAWCSPDAAAAFCTEATRSGLTVLTLEQLDDIDSLADAERLTAALDPRFTLLRRTLRALLCRKLPPVSPRPRARRCDRASAGLLRAPPAA
ncbi:MAG: DUF2064 domain-containing protein [Thermoanaerobaculia bacterium]